MVEHRTITAIFTLSILLLAPLAIIVPGAQAKEDNFTEIKNNDFWSKRIEKPNDDDDKWTYVISVDGVDGKYFDVYILEAKEYDNYVKNVTFTDKDAKENVTYYDEITFTITQSDKDFYLVVDNRDNIHPDDAYANDTITVDIIMEKEEAGFPFWLCITGGIIGAIVIVVIIAWVLVERKRGRRGADYEPFPPLKNPPLEKIRGGRK